MINLCLLLLAINQNTHFSDIKNRLENKTQYDKYINLSTRLHEQCHKVNNQLTNSKRKSTMNYTLFGFYCLNNLEFYLDSPKTTMQKTAFSIPLELRGSFYQSYLINYDKGWEAEPIYIIEEWVAYSNEVEGCPLDILDKNAILATLELAIYSIPLLEFSDQKLIEFYKWNVERTSKYYTEDSKNYMRKFYNSNFKNKLIKIYGEDWVKNHFGK